MKVNEFLNTKKISQNEKDICISVYGSQEKDANAWEKELADKVTFSEKKEKPSNVEEAKITAPEVKEEVKSFERNEPNKKNK